MITALLALVQIFVIEFIKEGAVALADSFREAKKKFKKHRRRE